MSSSYNKDRVYILSIHKAPTHLSAEDSKARFTSLSGEWINVPGSKTRKMHLIISNNMLDEYLQDAGYPVPPLTGMGRTEFESLDNLSETIKLGAGYFENPEYKPERGASLFIAESRILIDKHSTRSVDERVHRFIIFEVPEGSELQERELEEKLDELVGRFVRLPAEQKNVLKLTQWRQAQSSNMLANQLNIRHGKRVFIFEQELENKADLMELLYDQEHMDVQAECNKLFNVTMFTADVITKLDRDGGR